MSTLSEKEVKARFDARISLDKKIIMEKAAQIAGYRNLSDFVMSTAYEKAQKIIRKSETILTSQRDYEVFFNALMNPPEPNDNLKSAVRDYKNSISK